MARRLRYLCPIRIFHPARLYVKLKIMFSQKTIIILLGFIIILAVGTHAVLRYLNNSENLPDPKTSEPAGGVRVIDEIRSEEHTSELQSQFHIVCRLLL